MTAEMLFSLLLAGGFGVMFGVKRAKGVRKVLGIILGLVLMIVGGYGLITAAL